MQELKIHQENKAWASLLCHSSFGHIKYLSNIPPNTELFGKQEKHKVPNARNKKRNSEGSREEGRREGKIVCLFTSVALDEIDNAEASYAIIWKLLERHAITG